MGCYAFEGTEPQVHPEAFVAPTATLIGDVRVEKGASVWYGAVLRADICTIMVCEDANIQDNSVLHAGVDEELEIGRGATVAHGCVIHGSRIGAEALVGNGTVMLDHAVVGAGSLVAAGSVLSPGTEIPEGVLAAGAPAAVRKPIAGTPAETWVQLNPGYYAELAQRHRAGTHSVD